MAFVAVGGVASEQRIACFFIGCKPRFPCHHVVILRGERVDLAGRLVRGDRLRDLIEGSIGQTAVDCSEMNGVRIGSGRRTGSGAHALHIARPVDRKCLRAPHLFGDLSILTSGNAIHHTGRIDKSHLDRIQRRPLRLFGSWIVEPNSGGSHIPELASYQVSLKRVIVQYRGECCVGMGLRLPAAEPRAHRTRIGNRGHVESTGRTGEAGLRHMTERAGLVLVNGEILIEQNKLSQKRELSKRVKRAPASSLDAVSLDLVDPGFNLSYFRLRLRAQSNRPWRVRHGRSPFQDQSCCSQQN